MLLASFLAGCNFSGFASQSTVPNLAQATSEPLASTLPAPRQTQVTFHVQTPPGTPDDQPVFLVLLDEVTGLALNTQPVSMSHQPAGEAAGAPYYRASLSVAVGSLVRYRYERLAGAVRLAEHLADGRPVRYRQALVQGPGEIQDIVSRWVDTPYAGGLGRIYGLAVDGATQLPLPGMIVTAGGAQAYTHADGSFRLEGLPPGVHNLVVNAPDGAYQPFQQGAQVATGSITPALAALAPAKMVRGMFVVRAPEGTPPVVPLRMAGSLSQLGNSFADLTGGVNLATPRMPNLRALPDGRYTLTLNLPAGADIRYKYTLGDGFWNAERTTSGAIQLRQVIVPNENFVVEEIIESWSDHASQAPAITFDVQAPADTPAGETVWIQFAPLFGWTEPVPMWSLGNQRWAYVLYNPLGLPGNLGYRYCRNGLCGRLDDQQTAGAEAPGRQVELANPPPLLSDRVEAWAAYQQSAEQASLEAPPGVLRPLPTDFRLGFALDSAYHPAWSGLFPASFGDLRDQGANTVLLSPTWTLRNWTPGYLVPLFDQVAGVDMPWAEGMEAIAQAQGRSLAVWLYPQASLEAVDLQTWWETAARNPGWWDSWFSEYRLFALHHAELARQSRAQALVLGGAWLEPALPGGILPGGQPSGVPQNAGTRWRELLAEVRQHFSGPLYWSLSRQVAEDPPGFLDQVNGLYLEWSPQADETSQPRQALGWWLDQTGWTLYTRWGLPLILALEIPATPDLQAQVNFYQAALEHVNQREWIHGVISAGYLPYGRLQDAGPNVNGKPAGLLLKSWFQAWLVP